MPYHPPKADLTREDIVRRFDYDPETGRFMALAHLDKKGRWFCRLHGQQAGWLKNDGYVVLTIQGRHYKAHRVAWLWANGQWPDCDVDHKNGVRHDNRLANLRLASPSQTNWNRQANLGRSLPKGVLRYARKDGSCRYETRIWHRSKPRYLGSYGTPGEAQAAYDAAAFELRGPEWALDWSRRA